MKTRFACLLAVALAAAAFAGCASTHLIHVKPWQRGTLADPIMNSNRDPLQTAMSEHVYFSRESATGGRGVGGAGCGCN